jgi:DNA primase large subunit
VPFQRVLRLVEKRKVLLKKGKAYVPQKHIMQLVEGIYRAYLMAEIAKANKVRGLLEPAEQDRIIAFLDCVVENHNDSSSSSDLIENIDPSQKINRKQIHDVAQIHFPLCMRQLDEQLREDHHLKFTGRWQFGLFVKALGLTMEDALEFWKTEMTKKVPPETWNKSRYAYNIRHYYGTEGKRTSYTTMGCSKIINGPPPMPDIVHGCPFRHWSETQLRRELSKPRPHPANASINNKDAALFQAKIDLNAMQIEGIIKKAKDSFYTAACHAYFIAMHPGTKQESLFHNPILYYSASRQYSDQKQVSQNEPTLPPTSPIKIETRTTNDQHLSLSSPFTTPFHTTTTSSLQ